MKKLKNKGELAVVVVCAVVGFLLAAQLRSVKLNSAADATNASRLETLQNLYNEALDKQDGLEQQLAQAQHELGVYREEAAAGGGSAALVHELEQLSITAGLTDLEGPGVAVVLEDSSSANVTGDEADYLIHDSDLLSVINELRSAGAEAISLNGERILATSEIRCTGAVVTVNGRRYAAALCHHGHRGCKHPLQCTDHAQRRCGHPEPVGDHREGDRRRVAADPQV